MWGRFSPKAIRELCLEFLESEGIFLWFVILAVVELAPVVFVRGGDTSSKH
jgi:hypothetical protein